MKTLQERLQDAADLCHATMTNLQYQNLLTEAADRIDGLTSVLDALQITVEELRQENEALKANNSELLDQRLVLMEAVGEYRKCADGMAMSHKIERDMLGQHLSNLLARIHRDGGHYEAEHGTTKAVADADVLVAHIHAMQIDAERYRATRSQYYALTDMPHDEFDEVIDAAIATEKEQPNGNS